MGLFDILKKKVKVEKEEVFENKYGFSVAGYSYYQDNYKKVLNRNPDYNLPKSKINDEVYEYIPFKTFDVELIEEPENQYDPNAVKVVYKGLTVGYIKKGSTSRVKNLLKQPHKIETKFYGGNVKGWFECDEFTEEKNELKCRITIYTK